MKSNQRWHEWHSWALAAGIAILSWEVVLLAGYQPQYCGEDSKVCEPLQEPVSLLFYPLVSALDWVENNDKTVVALTGLAVAAFTFTLWRSTKALWQVTKDAGELARREFIASHQPRIIVRWPLLSKDGKRAQFSIENVGESRATILGSGARGGYYIFGQPLPTPHDISREETASLDRTFLDPGNSGGGTVAISGPRTNGMGEHIAFFGFITYRDEGPLLGEDDSRRIKTAYFAYWYDPAHNRFVRVKDTEYNEE